MSQQPRFCFWIQVGDGTISLTPDAKVQQVVCPPSDLAPIASASIADPYLVIRRGDGSSTLFVGDSVERKVSEATLPDGVQLPNCQAAEVFTDTTGVYRTFEATEQKAEASAELAKAAARSTKARTQLTGEQIKRLQETKPAIALDVETAESAFNASRGSQWLAVLTTDGELQLRRLPDLALVLQSNGVSLSEASFTDDAVGDSAVASGDPVLQLLFCPIGKHTVRPHLIVLHASGRANIYEAQPRFTLDAQYQSRRSLAVRFRKVFTQLFPVVPGSKLAYQFIPFADIEGLTGAFLKGERPQWIISSDAHPVRAFGLKQAAYAFCKTTHLGGRGEYFMRIEDVSDQVPPSTS